MKKTLLSLLLARSLMSQADDSTNAPSLQMPNPTNIVVNQSATARVYSLLENTNLLEDVWTEVNSQRGNGSNLVLEIINDSPTKFYKSIANYRPLGETNFQAMVSGTPGKYTPTTRRFNFEVNNYITNSIEAKVDFIVNATYGGYTASKNTTL